MFQKERFVELFSRIYVYKIEIKLFNAKKASNPVK